MIKNLRYVFVSMLMLLCGTVSAQTVFDFDSNGKDLFGLKGESNNDGGTDGDITEAVTATIGGYSVTVSAANEGASNANRLWNASPKLRIYSGTLTITSTQGNMKSIVFTLHNQASKAKWGAANSASVGTIDATAKTSATWTGDANEVVFTIAANTQISKITISGEEGGGGTTIDPDALGQKNNPYTVAQAFEELAKLDVNVKSDEVYVKGKISEIAEVSVENGNATYYISDDGTNNNQLYVFRGKFLKNANFTAEGQIAVNDEVVVCGILVNYRSSKAADTDPTTPEITQPNYIYMLNGKTEDDTPVTIETAANIKAFKAMAENTVAELTLTNATVLYKNVNGSNTELFIRDSSGAMDLYNMGITAEAGQVLNGTIIGMRGANSGFTPSMKSHSKTDVATVTVSGEAGDVEAVNIGFDEAADYYCDYVLLNDVTLSEDLKKALDEDSEELPLYDRFQLKLLSNLKTDTQYDIYGLMYDGGEQYGPELVVTKVTMADGSAIQEEEATAVASIGALLAMESPSNNLELTLTNAKVLFNDNNYIYVRENGKALCFFKIDGLKDVAKNNAVINGKINVDYEVYKLLPEVKANTKTNLNGLTIVESEEAAEPVATTLADVAAGKNVCDLVTLTATLLKEVTYKEDGTTVQSTTYKLKDGEVELVVVNNGKNLSKIEAGTEITVVGIVNTASEAYQVKLTKNVETDTEGINTVATENGKTVVYNLAGQRVEKAVKGLYIVGGKKVLVK